SGELCVDRNEIVHATDFDAMACIIDHGPVVLGRLVVEGLQLLGELQQGDIVVLNHSKPGCRKLGAMLVVLEGEAAPQHLLSNRPLQGKDRKEARPARRRSDRGLRGLAGGRAPSTSHRPRASRSRPSSAPGYAEMTEPRPRCG